jgi:hypothetical protein
VSDDELRRLEKVARKTRAAADWFAWERALERAGRPADARAALLQGRGIDEVRRELVRRWRASPEPRPVATEPRIRWSTSLGFEIHLGFLEASPLGIIAWTSDMHHTEEPGPILCLDPVTGDEVWRVEPDELDDPIGIAFSRLDGDLLFEPRREGLVARDVLWGTERIVLEGGAGLATDAAFVRKSLAVIPFRPDRSSPQTLRVYELLEGGEARLAWTIDPPIPEELGSSQLYNAFIVTRQALFTRRNAGTSRPLGQPGRAELHSFVARDRATGRVLLERRGHLVAADERGFLVHDHHDAWDELVACDAAGDELWRRAHRGQHWKTLGSEVVIVRHPDHQETFLILDRASGAVRSQVGVTSREIALASGGVYGLTTRDDGSTEGDLVFVTFDGVEQWRIPRPESPWARLAPFDGGLLAHSYDGTLHCLEAS